MLTSSRTPSGPRRVTTSPSTAKSFAARCCGDWWPQEVSEKLQQFYDDLVNGQRPKVAIMAPPQHGKSTAATDFVTWVAGKDPNLKTIFASFSDQLGERTNKEVQRIMRIDAYIKIFGRTRLESASGTRPAPRSTKSVRRWSTRRRKLGMRKMFGQRRHTPRPKAIPFLPECDSIPKTEIK